MGVFKKRGGFLIMFAHVKKAGKYKYLQIIEDHKNRGTVKQLVIVVSGEPVLIFQMNSLNVKDLIYV